MTSNEQLSRLARSDQYLGKDRDQLREIILDRDEEIAQLSDALQDAREVNYESEVAGLVAENKRLQGAFKNFHRLLCERFGCAHDEKDWERDQLSLIEWIAKRYSRDETSPALGNEPWRVALPALTDEYFQQFGGRILLIDVEDGGRINWTQEAVDFACMIQGVRKDRPAFVEPAIEPFQNFLAVSIPLCAHDLHRPDNTISVLSATHAKCRACGEEWKMPPVEPSPVKAIPDPDPNERCGYCSVKRSLHNAGGVGSCGNWRPQEKASGLCVACGHHDQYHFDDGKGNVVCRWSETCVCIHRTESITPENGEEKQ